jgi:hypothetical protein
MPETKYVKIVFDGQEYWLLWRWRPDIQPMPDNLTAGYSHVSGPFERLSKAQEAIPNDWTPIPFRRPTVVHSSELDTWGRG